MGPNSNSNFSWEGGEQQLGALCLAAASSADQRAIGRRVERVH